MQCAAAMHPSLKELAAKVAEARKKEHKPRFSPDGAQPESLCNSLEPQIKQQQEQAQKLGTSIPFFKDTLKCLLQPSCILLQNLLRWWNKNKTFYRNQCRDKNSCVSPALQSLWWRWRWCAWA